MPTSFTGPEEFYASQEADWWSAVDKALKEAPRERLYTRSEDRLDVAPLYERRKDAAARILRPGNRDWPIVQRADGNNLADANYQILEDLTEGAGGLSIVLQERAFGKGQGVCLSSVEDVAILLNGVKTDLIEIQIDGGSQSANALHLILKMLQETGNAVSTFKISCRYDPFGAVNALKGATQKTEDDVTAALKVLKTALNLGSPARIFSANGQDWHNAGASPVQELAAVLASSVTNLRLLEGVGLDTDEMTERLSVTLAADADQFGTIAKARAFRKLWASVLDGAGLPQVPARLHMETSYRMLTRRDPWVNLLRNTVAVFAAGIGGADTICVLPHTQAVGLPDAFARRLARNTQSVLLEESGLAKVMDPAAGSGAIEERTEQLCAAAWKLFQDIEQLGGISSPEAQALLKAAIEDNKEQLSRAVSSRKRPVTGVSEFPNLGEEPVNVLVPSPGDETAGTGMPDLWRTATSFEGLRDAADAYQAQTGEKPKIFLASLGKLSEFTARATWVANAFAAGGFEAVGLGEYSSDADLVTAFGESGAALTSIVSSDGVYAEKAEAAAAALRKAGAKHIYLAGKPGEAEASYRAAGIGSFIFAGCDILGLLGEAHGLLGIQSEGAGKQEART